MLPKDVPAGSHPTGPAWPVTRQWKQLVEQLMDDQGISRAELARRVGVKPPSITALLGPSSKQSRLVPLVQKALKMGKPELPASNAIDEKRARLAEALEKLSPTDVDTVIDLAELLARRGDR